MTTCEDLKNCSGNGLCLELPGKPAECRCNPGFAGQICNEAGCIQGDFYNIHTGQCQPCTRCDADHIVQPGTECTGQTTFDNMCTPIKKCQPGEFVNSLNQCQKCRTCEPGWTPVGTCEGKMDTVCKKIECKKGYFYEEGACTPCTKCKPGQTVQAGTECDGTTTLDNMCVDMDQKKSRVCSDVRTDRGGAFEFQGQIDGYIHGDKSCLPCSNCVDGFCKPGQYFNGRTLKCEPCRTCVDFDFHKGLKPNQPPCDGTRTTNNLCVQLCRDNQYAKAGETDWMSGHETGVTTGKYPGAVWWNEMTCHNCDTCASGKTEINPCNGNTLSKNACKDHDTFWCGEDEDTCTWEQNPDPYFSGKGQTADWGNKEAQRTHCRNFSKHMTGDPQLYSEPAGFKKISTFGYKTYMLGCTIPDQYKGSTACTNKVNKQDCNYSKGCGWCGGNFPSCRPLDKQTMISCRFDDRANCDIGYYHDDTGYHCPSGCTACYDIEPTTCVPSNLYEDVCQKWP
jgi:hypothetical protein